MRVFNRAIKAKTSGKVIGVRTGAKIHMGKGIWEEDMQENGTVLRAQECVHRRKDIGVGGNVKGSCINKDKYTAAIP